MERLTERFNNGQAAVMGCGENCKYDYKYCRNHYEECPEINKIYERLAEYEDTGLTPEQIRELKERDMAKIVNLIPFDGCDDDSDITYKAYCPICKRYIGILFKKGYKGKGDNFCRNCGQRLKWEE